jgi:hypothetical protein
VVRAIEDFWFMTATLPDSIEAASSPKCTAAAASASHAVS